MQDEDGNKIDVLVLVTNNKKVNRNLSNEDLST
jgi:hypothetical protein